MQPCVWQEINYNAFHLLVLCKDSISANKNTFFSNIVLSHSAGTLAILRDDNSGRHPNELETLVLKWEVMNLSCYM